MVMVMATATATAAPTALSYYGELVLLHQGLACRIGLERSAEFHKGRTFEI